MLASAQANFQTPVYNFIPPMPNPAPQPKKNMANLEWQSETIDGNYSGEVALFFQDQQAIHCEALETGHWHIWQYRGDSIETLQKGQLNDVASAQAACQRVINGLFSQHANVLNVPSASVMMPQYYPSYEYPSYAQPSYDNEASLQDDSEDAVAPAHNPMRQQLRIWALLTTLLGALLLTLWYGFLYQPAKTTTVVACVIMLSWAGMALRRWLEQTFRSPSLKATMLSQQNG